MAIGLLEYHAGQKLAMRAGDLRMGLGANEFYSLLSAMYTFAGTFEAEALNRAFPGTWDEMRKRYNAPAGLIRPGESITINNVHTFMRDDGTIGWEEVKEDAEDESEDEASGDTD